MSEKQRIAALIVILAVIGVVCYVFTGLISGYDRLIRLGRPAVGNGLACLPQKLYAVEARVKSTVE